MRYHTINLAVIGTALLGLGQALVVPGPETSSNNLMTREQDMLIINIEPEWTNPQCGESKAVELSWKDKNHAARGESGECLKFKEFLSERQAQRKQWDVKVEVKMDLVATDCRGGYSDPWTNGKTKHTRVAFTPDEGQQASVSYGGLQKVWGQLVVDSPIAGRIASPRVAMGVLTDHKKLTRKYQYIYCDH
ncbi:hypothetical protein LTR84_011730 [Exophiala bonariae]|uniref:Ecp2 effector protein domain-containing protein n=1 Tax=Exophiala bonariae TaxID=1690606 RepID=A0AAV9NKG5_9EURO|nr:hypothetical protein LTR84_011730 [Exophiala bonariae]